LEKGGVVIKRNGREFSVKDGQGSFGFVDDFYYSGFSFLLKKLSKFFKVPVEFLNMVRYPSSLKKEMVAKNVWNEASPVKAARDYLVSLHEEGDYDVKRLVLKLQGGSFSEMRPIVFKSFAIEGPTATPYSKSAVGFKVSEFCLKAGHVSEMWVDLKNVLRFVPSELLRSTFVIRDPEKRLVENRWVKYKKQFRGGMKFEEFQASLEVDFEFYKSHFGELEAKRMIASYFFNKRNEINAYFPP